MQRQDGRKTIALSAQHSAPHISNYVVRHRDGRVVEQRQDSFVATASDKDQRNKLAVLVNHTAQRRAFVLVVGIQESAVQICRQVKFKSNLHADGGLQSSGVDVQRPGGECEVNAFAFETAHQQ